MKPCPNFPRLYSPFTKQLLPILLASLTALHAETDPREISSKKVSLNWVAGITPKEWSHDITQEDWLKMVTSPNTELLHSLKNDEFYFAIFRKDGHLILWTHDRNSAYTGSNLQVIDSKGRSVISTDEPSKMAILDIEWKSISDKTNDKPLINGISVEANATGRMLGDVFKIDPAFRGDLIVRFIPSSKKKSSQAPYLLKANWK